jgi:RNA polymerase sigma factor (sigma-70 family)
VSTEAPSVAVIPRQGPPSGQALAEFERIYRANVGALSAYFARRCREPQDVADLTSETVLQAASSFPTFDARRGTPRAWLFGIAKHVYARHCAGQASGRDAVERLAGHRPLARDEYEELLARVDAEAPGRALLRRAAALSDTEREALELVDLMDLSPKEAASALGVPRGVLRMRLSRARSRLRKDSTDHAAL